MEIRANYLYICPLTIFYTKMRKETLIEITNHFEKDVKTLTQNEQEDVKKKINFLIDSFRENGRVNQLYRLRKIQLPDNLTSSLFVYRVNEQLRIILTFENDPLFDQTIFTLFRLVKSSELEISFTSIEKSLYQNLFDHQGLSKNGRN